MARVKMNSAISSQPAVTGPNTNITIGLAIRNSRITCLYQLGALPRKLRVNPETRVSGIASVLLELVAKKACNRQPLRSEEHTSELQSRPHLVCRLLLEKKNRHLNRR